MKVVFGAVCEDVRKVEGQYVAAAFLPAKSLNVDEIHSDKAFSGADFYALAK